MSSTASSRTSSTSSSSSIFNIGVGIVLGIIGIAVMTGTGGNISTNWVGSLIYAFVGLAISGAYFVYLVDEPARQRSA